MIKCVLFTTKFFLDKTLNFRLMFFRVPGSQYPSIQPIQNHPIKILYYITLPKRIFLLKKLNNGPFAKITHEL